MVTLGSQTLPESLAHMPGAERTPGHIAFVLTHGFMARMVLRSGMARQLSAQGLRITAISPNADEAYFQEECQQERIALCQNPPHTGRIANLFRTYRPYLLDDIMGNAALQTRHAQLFAQRALLRIGLETVNKHLAPHAWFRAGARHLERQLNRSQPIVTLLRDLRPDYLVLPNPFGTQETMYMVHARDLGIPVVCQMLSWDNITSKGTPLMMPDYFISWGPIMTDEMMNLYHFAPERIYECGVPHFDVYAHPEHFTPREDILRRLNLPPTQPYLLYGMVAPFFAPRELDVLTWLVEKIRAQALARPCSLVIRPHPQTIRGFYAYDRTGLERLQALTGPQVALDMPPVLSDRLAWDLPKSDMYTLASLLAGSAMCLSVGSTLCLDACMVDCPVISVGFDGWEVLPYDQSARRGLDFIHIKKMLALGGVRVARSFGDLEAHINTYLREPHLERAERAQTVAQECGPRDGRAAQRVAATLASLCQSPGPARH
ncbi:MAG: hypothetical protein AB7N91_16700 [Candidatus Tectimicrobiota bacterium]